MRKEHFDASSTSMMFYIIPIIFVGILCSISASVYFGYSESKQASLEQPQIMTLQQPVLVPPGTMPTVVPNTIPNAVPGSV